MHKLALLIGGALVSQLLCFSAAAQEPGAGTASAAPYKKTTPEDRAAGKAHRKEEGRAAAKAGTNTGEGQTPPSPPQAKLPRAQREQERAQRKTETARAAKAGELSRTGEVGPLK